MQQSTMTCRWNPAVLRGPDLGHVHAPQLVRAADPEEPGAAPTIGAARGLQQLVGAHDPLRPLPVDRLAELTGRERSDDPGAVGRVRLGDLDDRVVAGTASAQARRNGPRRDRPVDRLPGDASHPCHHRRAASVSDHGARSRTHGRSRPILQELPRNLHALVAGSRQRRLPALQQRSRHWQYGASAISYSRYTSRTARSPRSPANTTSAFCSGVNVRYFLFSLTPLHEDQSDQHPQARNLK